MQRSVSTRIRERKRRGAWCALALVLAIGTACGRARAQGADAGEQLRIGEKHAVVIGIGRYQESELNLGAAAADAHAMASLLGSPELTGGYKVRLLADEKATRVSIARALSDMKATCGPNDTAVFFYSGHAFRDRSGTPYLFPHDGQRAVLEDTGYSLSRVFAIMREMTARQKILILDCCHSGAVSEQVLASAKGADERGLSEDQLRRMMSGSGLVVLSSSQGDQLSWEDNGPGGSGLGFFTKHLLAGLKGQADRIWGKEGRGNRDGFVSIAELSDFVYYRANGEVLAAHGTPQQAKLFSDVSGTVLLTRVKEAGVESVPPADPAVAPTVARVVSVGPPGGVAMAATVDAQGRLILAGQVPRAGRTGAWEMVVARLLPDGRVDGSFGREGHVVVRAGPYDDGASAVLAMGDGSIIAGGRAEVRGFGYDMGIVRLREDGGRYSGFGQAGMITTSLGSQRMESAALQALLPRGEDGFLAVGTGKARGTHYLALVAYDGHGRLQPGFGEAGMVRVPMPGESSGSARLAVDGRGRIVVAAAVQSAKRSTVAYARFDASGRIDPEFAGGRLSAVGFPGAESSLALFAGDDGGVRSLAVANEAGSPAVRLVQLGERAPADRAAGVREIPVGAAPLAAACALRAEPGRVVLAHQWTDRGFTLWGARLLDPGRAAPGLPTATRVEEGDLRAAVDVGGGRIVTVGASGTGGDRRMTAAWMAFDR